MMKKKVLPVILLLFSLNVHSEEKTVQFLGYEINVASSSTLPSKIQDAYSVKNLFDDDLKTAWVENAKGSGKGEWIRITFPETVELEGFCFIPGYTKSYTTLTDNYLPRVLEVSLDGTVCGRYSIGYQQSYHEGKLNGCFPDNVKINFSKRLILFSQTRKVKEIKVLVAECLDFTEPKYEDLALSEFQPIIRNKGWIHDKAYFKTLMRIIRAKDYDSLKIKSKDAIEELNYKKLAVKGVMFGTFDSLSDIQFTLKRSQSDISGKEKTKRYAKISNFTRVQDRPTYQNSRLFNFFNESYNGIAGSVVSVSEIDGSADLLASPTVEIFFHSNGEVVYSAIYPHFEIDGNGIIQNAEEWIAIRYAEPFCIDLPKNRKDLR